MNDVAQSCLNIVQKVDTLVNASYTPTIDTYMFLCAVGIGMLTLFGVLLSPVVLNLKILQWFFGGGIIFLIASFIMLWIIRKVVIKFVISDEQRDKVINLQRQYKEDIKSAREVFKQNNCEFNMDLRNMNIPSLLRKNR